MRLRHRVAALGVAAVVVGGSALWGAGVGSAATARLTLVYNCPFPLIGAQDMSVEIVVEDLPDTAVVGEPVPEARVTATATVPELATQGLRLVGAVSVEGTASAQTVVDNAGLVLDIVPDLTVAKTAVPESGAFDTVATGTTPSLSFPFAGATTIDVGDFVTTLTPRTADGSETGLGTFTSPCTLKPGQSTRLHEFTVRPEGTTTTTEPTTTTTTTTTTEPTTTTTDSTTTTTEPTTTTTTTTSTTDSTTTDPTTTTTTSPTTTTTTTTTTTRPTTTTTTSTTTAQPTTSTTTRSTTTTAPTSTTTSAATSTTTSATTSSSTTTTTSQTVVPVSHPDKTGLAYTGSSITGPLVLGGALLALGAGVLLRLRHTRRRT
ncbi:hypothetical protein IOD16_11205 [Saccharothrix sp. 6-C]|uniref:DUF6801 domain-containing protein n=1 Tax=Saccharothrix sp. 6-C TaxID=2781735 RepID=UPI001AF142BA|nr:DUF6801 domain-containing protein [Saccharothrix sp. 6-C]QQQ78935.1 hypothetical protein IOD16_11205 [Saccharothrix sp. 6-C]